MPCSLPVITNLSPHFFFFLFFFAENVDELDPDLLEAEMNLDLEPGLGSSFGNFVDNCISVSRLPRVRFSHRKIGSS